MLGDDAAHDRQTKATSAPLRRIVRKEELLAFDRRDPRAIVGDDDTYEAVGAVELRFDDDLASAVHRFDRIVDEVDDHAPQLFDVEPDERDVAGKAPHDRDV